ncbi:MAG TPA: holo-ACP synthase [Victivallales bacterium]|nr:holo-ACP synthase [Victivallales bacterium]HPO89812.1 holo-ACP synthase [Victivallales bacterium]HRR06899.1 holo-ACP synthase [Victivallales bacterium]HRU00869.1 holo-ACP synthase [Victivallales bacterium]
MISGIGTDIVQVARMEELIKKHGEKFLQKIFTDFELESSKKRADKTVFLSARWAAKEAVSKALKCGIGRDCAWRDINIKNDKNGAPFVELTGKASELAEKQNVSNIQLSISHDKDYAVALVVIERRKNVYRNHSKSRKIKKPQN